MQGLPAVQVQGLPAVLPLRAQERPAGAAQGLPAVQVQVLACGAAGAGAACGAAWVGTSVVIESSPSSSVSNDRGVWRYSRILRYIAENSGNNSWSTAPARENFGTLNGLLPNFFCSELDRGVNREERLVRIGERREVLATWLDAGPLNLEQAWNHVAIFLRDDQHERMLLGAPRNVTSRMATPLLQRTLAAWKDLAALLELRSIPGEAIIFSSVGEDLWR